MKFTYVHTSLLLAARVFADAGLSLADEYAVIYYWYAYVLENDAEGQSPQLIAPGCSVPGESPICYFDEFLRYIQADEDGTISWAGKTSLGEIGNYLVDADAAANLLLKLGYVAVVDAAKLLPGKFAAGASAAYSDILDGVNSVILQSRTTLIAAGKDISAYMTGLTKSMASTTHYRLQTQAGAQISAFVDWCKAKKCTFSIFTETITNSDGSSYQALDVATMYKNNPALRAAVTSGIQSFMKDYANTGGTWPGSTTPDPSARINFKTIQASTGALSGIQEAPHC